MITDENCPNCGRSLSQHSNNELVKCAINELNTSLESPELRGVTTG